MVCGGRIGIIVSASASGGSVSSSLNRSLGPDNELLLTWTNPNGDVIPMEITYIAFYDNHISTTANLSVSRSTFGDSEEDLPKIVSQGIAHPTRVVGCCSWVDC